MYGRKSIITKVCIVGRRVRVERIHLLNNNMPIIFKVD